MKSKRGPGGVPLRKLRIMLRAKKNRLWRDIQRYGVLYPTPAIEQQLADWRTEYKQAQTDLLGIERRLARGEE